MDLKTNKIKKRIYTKRYSLFPIIKQCKRCSNNFNIKRRDKLNQKFCSRDCLNKFYKEKYSIPIEKICPICKKRFIIKSTKLRNQKYCSIKCSRKKKLSKTVKKIISEKIKYLYKYDKDYIKRHKNSGYNISDKERERRGKRLKKIMNNLTDEQKEKMNQLRRSVPKYTTSKQESIVKDQLIKNNIKYFQHMWVKDISYKYQCDFFIPEFNIIIECDGDYWHNYPYGNKRDHIRNKEMIKEGYIVLRFWEHEINNKDFILNNKILKNYYKKKESRLLYESK